MVPMLLALFQALAGQAAVGPAQGLEFVEAYLWSEHADAGEALEFARAHGAGALRAGDAAGATIARALEAQALAWSQGPFAARPLLEPEFERLSGGSSLEAVVVELAFVQVLALQGHYGPALDLLLELRERVERLDSATLAFQWRLLEYELRFETQALQDPFALLEEMRAGLRAPELARLDAWPDYYAQWFLFMEGRLLEAQELCEQVIRRARAEGDRRLLAQALGDSALEAYLSGESERAFQRAEESLAVAEQGSYLVYVGLALEVQGRVLLEAGRLDEAWSRYERLRREFVHVGLESIEPTILDLGKSVAAARNDADALLELFQQEEWAPEDTDLWLELTRARGEVNRSERAVAEAGARLAEETARREALVRYGLAAALGVTTLLLSFLVAGRLRLRRANERLKQEMELTRAAQGSQRETEHRLQKLARLRGLGVMAGGVAHDFNNLLTGVIGNVDLMLTSGRLPAELESQARAVMEAGERGAAICKRLLVYAGKAPTGSGVLELNELIENVLPLLATAAGRAVELRFDRAPEPVWISADPTRIDQALLNFVTNAREARARTVTVRVAVEAWDGAAARAPEEAALLSVEDDGVGMDENVREHLFEPFFSTRLEGRGLGLAEVFGIVEEHGGRIDVRSAPGQGACFRVRLPRRAGPVNGSEPLAEAGRGAQARLCGTVLVVDDEPHVRALVSECLSAFGLEVVAVASGEEALKHLEREPRPSCMLLDMTMPGLSGSEVLERVRRGGLDLPVVLMSGHFREDVLARVPGERLAVLTKPFRSKDLRAAIASALT